MKATFAVLIGALSAIESFLIALLFIMLLVPPGGSGEFKDLDRLAPTLVALVFLPPLIFGIVFALVWRTYRPENHKAFRSFAWALGTALAVVPAVMMLVPDDGLAPWPVGISAVVLAVWTAVIVWRRLVLSNQQISN